MIATGIDLIEKMQEFSELLNKIFVRDVLDEPIANNILIFFKDRENDLNCVELCLHSYISHENGFVVSVKDFASKIEPLYRAVLNDLEAKKRFDLLAKKTKDRMIGS